MSLERIVLGILAAALVVAGGYGLAARQHWLGELEPAGEPTAARIPEARVAERAAAQRSAADGLAPGSARPILFGDLHVHTTFSTDAFLWSLPMMQGDGAHPVSDACDYARFCSGLDFWSINDHAEATTPRRWKATREAIRQCNEIAGDASAPDVTAFMGWEWSQVGRTPEEHYGHKNVILKGLEEQALPARPIAAGGFATTALRGSIGGMSWIMPLLDFPRRQRYFNFIEFMDELRSIPACEEGVPSPDLPPNCYESAATPADLFEKLGQWTSRGVEHMVIPHGNTWGYYSPPGIRWDKQLAGAMHDPSQQFLVEIMSGHGNSEEVRDWRAARIDANGGVHCPQPTSDYLPSCWRAGEIVEERCRAAGETEATCATRALQARRLYLENGVAGHHVVQGEGFEEWLDAGQCVDCFRPSFNYRPGGSTQYALAISNFDQLDASGDPRRFQFGIIASSDNHRARPGTGYKEVDRLLTTEANGARDETWRRRISPPEEPLPRAVPIDSWDFSRGFQTLEAERQSSFFMTGGLAAVHAESRSRDAIWSALERKEVYGTSGQRILLWLDLLNAEGPDGTPHAVPMGSQARVKGTPRFEVRAAGSLEQNPGCPDFALQALAPQDLARLCRGECYNPSDRRRQITRIEVVRIRPQIRPEEPVASLVEDPWRVFDCAPDPAGCVVQFEDPEFAEAERDSVYYVRAIEEPTPTINAENLRCTYDESGRCVETRPCYGDYRTPASDACTSPSEERAWSSPIFIDAI